MMERETPTTGMRLRNMAARLGPIARRLEFHIAIEPKDTTVPNIAIIPTVDPVNGTVRKPADSMI